MKKPLTISDQGLFHDFLAERESAYIQYHPQPFKPVRRQRV